MNERQIANLKADLRQILGSTTRGETQVPNVRLAQIHAYDWQATRTPPSDSERGGSSSPVEQAERKEDRAVAHQAIRDAAALDTLIPAFEAELVVASYRKAPTVELVLVAERLAQVIERCVRTVDHDLLQDPECRSCARPGKVGKVNYPGHKNVAVYAKSIKHRLCRWCHDHWLAENRLPPVDVIHLYHTRGPRAAGIELAKRTRGKTNGNKC